MEVKDSSRRGPKPWYANVSAATREHRWGERDSRGPGEKGKECDAPPFLCYHSTSLRWGQVWERRVNENLLECWFLLVLLSEGDMQIEMRAGLWGVLAPPYLASSLLSSLFMRIGWEPSAGCWTQLLSWSPTRQPGVSLSVRRQHIQ